MTANPFNDAVLSTLLVLVYVAQVAGYVWAIVDVVRARRHAREGWSS